jgi:cytochrome P450
MAAWSTTNEAIRWRGEIVTLGAHADEVHLDDLPLAVDRDLSWHTLLDAGSVVPDGDQFVLCSAAAVEYATKHPNLFSSAKAFDMLGSPLPLVPIAVDPPEHGRFRRMLDSTFAPRRLALLEDRLRGQVVELIDKIAEKDTCEVIADLGLLYPTEVFLTIFGLPVEDRERLIAWKDAILELTGPSAADPDPAVMEHALGLFAYLSEIVAQRRAGVGVGDDLLSELLANTDEGGFSDEEVLGLGFLMVLAGLDTVTSAIGFALHRLAERPDLQAKLVDDPTQIPQFVEEALRMEPPAPFAPRITTEDVEVEGRHIPAGSQVKLAYGAANRDPARYDHADDVALDRHIRHFAFGGGVHRCLGSHLARMEMRLMLEEWHRRIHRYELAPGVPCTAKWPSGTLVLESVPLVLTEVVPR